MLLSGLEYYDYLMSIGDARVESWGLMWSPVPTVAITALYLLMCLRGPRLMAPYQALQLRPVVVMYNMFCAGLNLYIFLEILLTSRQIQYSWTCQPVDYSSDPASVRIARALWWYYISKLVELCGEWSPAGPCGLMLIYCHLQTVSSSSSVRRTSSSSASSTSTTTPPCSLSGGSEPDTWQEARAF